MTGDQIRAMTFPQRRGGSHAYSEGYVNELLCLLAALRDFGLSEGAFMPREPIPRVSGFRRGCEIEAVDQALAGLGYTPRPDGLRRHPRPGASDRVPAGWATGHRAAGEGPDARRPLERDCETRWASVADLAGPHLLWSSRLGEYLALCGDAGFSTNKAELRRLVAGRHREMQPLRTWTVASGGQTFITRHGFALVVNAETREPVLRVMAPSMWGVGWAWRFAELPGQCLLRFAVKRATVGVRGDRTKSGYAVMTGTDQSGADVLWFRMGRRGQFETVEIVAGPDWQLTPQALILICVVAPWLREHYHSSASSVDFGV
jgi:hypothetical protein